jgi:hypothetical protein
MERSIQSRAIQVKPSGLKATGVAGIEQCILGYRPGQLGSPGDCIITYFALITAIEISIASWSAE